MQREGQTRDGLADDGQRLIEALRDPGCYPHAVAQVRVIETHISYVMLTGTFAYKIKKRVNLGFVDFTTLEKRKHYCEEELRLNARLAPELYLALVPIGGTPQAPRLGAGTPVIDYAVKMREFPQEALAGRAIGRGELGPAHIDALAQQVAVFHAGLPRAAGGDGGYGAPEAIQASCRQNFSQMRTLPVAAADRPLLDEIEASSTLEHARLREVFLQRQREGSVRECHGDLHLGNIVVLGGAPRIFDCVEFNAQLRCIDIVNDSAFLVMDLRAAGRPDLAARFLNAWLERTGDYAGLRVLRYYLVYRAMVRAKVALMRAATGAAVRCVQDQCHCYIALARGFIRRSQRFVLITHGFSGSGKTTASQGLVELTGAIRIRSDVERKRLGAAVAAAAQPAPVASGLYSARVSEQTYRRLLELAQVVLDAGLGVIVDAAFLKARQRELFRDLAARAGAPFGIVDFNAELATLRSRIGARAQQGRDASDADLAVLDYQLSTHEPLQPAERATVLSYDASRPRDDSQRPQSWSPLLQRLLPPAGRG